MDLLGPPGCTGITEPSPALLTRRSCAQLGYMEDPFVKLFVRRPMRRPTIINRGAAVCGTALSVWFRGPSLTNQRADGLRRLLRPPGDHPPAHRALPLSRRRPEAGAQAPRILPSPLSCAHSASPLPRRPAFRIQRPHAPLHLRLRFTPRARTHNTICDCPGGVSRRWLGHDVFPARLQGPRAAFVR